MPEPGLTKRNWTNVLSEKATTSGWGLCIGAGTSRPLFPDWQKLVDDLIARDPNVSNPSALSSELGEVFSLDALIEASRDRLGLSSGVFARRLSKYLYATIKTKVGKNDWPLVLQALTAGSPGQLTRTEWAKFLSKVLAISPHLSAFQIAEVVHTASARDLPPSAILSFNAEPLLYALINAVSAREALPNKRLKDYRLLDRVTRGISYRKAGRIPFIFCHGLMRVEGGYKLFNKSTAQDKLVFSEGEYLQLANSAFTWQSSLFLGTAVFRSMVFVGLSFTDPNLRRWLAWIQKNKVTELRSKGKHEEVYGHYWIKSMEGTTPTSRRWFESAVRHLGVRLVWIENWEQTGLCLREMLGFKIS